VDAERERESVCVCVCVCVCVTAVTVQYGTWPVVVAPLQQSKWPHLKTLISKGQRYGHGSWRGPIPRTTVLARTSSKLLDWTNDTLRFHSFLSTPLVHYFHINEKNMPPQTITWSTRENNINTREFCCVFGNFMLNFLLLYAKFRITYFEVSHITPKDGNRWHLQNFAFLWVFQNTGRWTTFKYTVILSIRIILNHTSKVERACTFRTGLAAGRDNKFWEELIAHFPMIWHGPHSKRRLRQFLDVAGNVYRTDRGYTSTDPQILHWHYADRIENASPTVLLFLRVYSLPRQHFRRAVA
jgi:hypothetical protein